MTDRHSPPSLRSQRHRDGGRPRVSRLGPFPQCALELFDHGLCPVPCGGRDAKRPTIKFGNWPPAPGRKLFEILASSERFQEDQIGILTGRGRFPVVVVDCDDLTQVARIMTICGDTPLIVATPSGGRHLYYQYSGERQTNLRPFGFAADVKGRGVFVVVPPSSRRRWGKKPAGKYSFVRGNWSNVAQLPLLAAGAMDLLKAGPASSRSDLPKSGQPPATGTGIGHQVPEGGRNDAAFRYALRLAKQAADANDILAGLERWNLHACEVPLPNDELPRAAQSAWGYEVDGTNMVGRGGLTLMKDEVRDIGDANALWLFAHLVFAHAAREEPFAIAARAMAHAGTVPGMGEHKIRNARERLLDAGYIKKVSDGCAVSGAPATYRLRYPRRGSRV